MLRSVFRQVARERMPPVYNKGDVNHAGCGQPDRNC